jgi:hypothetical protein
LVEIVRFVVTVLASGVSVAGLNVQAANAGNPAQEKLIGLTKEPCGVTVTVYVPDCPGFIVALAGFEDKAKSAAKT